ncbi:MAG: hypothetical protein JWP87_2481 [Labilithrix sp.]|nr:hypothetical protein [Labilithrix sp.]
MNANTVGAPSATDGIWARASNAILGIWLIVSVYLWPHITRQVTNAWVVGVLTIVFAAIAAFVAPRARFANTALGIWLVFSTFVTGTISAATLWNDIFVGALMLGVSLVPNRRLLPSS